MDIFLQELQKNLKPYSEKVETIKGQIHSLNESLSQCAIDLTQAQEKLKLKFLEQVRILKEEYQKHRRRIPGLEAQWPGCIMFIRRIRNELIDLGVVFLPHEQRIIDELKNVF